MTIPENETMSGRLDFVATALDPIHHGAGTEGNTQLLRVQDIVLPDGEPARVPFISGNSYKHTIRDGGVRFAIEVMGIEEGSLAKPVVDLLFSGGHLSKTGGAVDLARARGIAELFPILSVCGYSAGNFMQESKIAVDNLNMVCSENDFRMPSVLVERPQAKMRAAAFRGEEFGTRHEATRSQYAYKLLTGASKDKREKLLEGKLRGGEGKGDSSQMYYEFEVLMPGALFYGGLYFDDLTQMEMAALLSALERACVGKHTDGGLIYRIGAKSSIGLGRMSLVFSGGLREQLRPPVYTEDNGIVPAKDARGGRDALAGYVAHLRDRKEEILAALDGVMS